MFPCAYKLKNKFHFEEEGIRNIFLWDFRSSYSLRLHKISQFNNKCTPTISERCHQRSMLPALWKTSWATRKVFQMFNGCVAEENLQEEL